MEMRKVNWHDIKSATKNELEELVTLCIGRVFRIMSRPFQEGDNEDYSVCREIAIDAVHELEERFGVVLQKSTKWF